MRKLDRKDWSEKQCFELCVIDPTVLVDVEFFEKAIWFYRQTINLTDHALELNAIYVTGAITVSSKGDKCVN